MKTIEPASQNELATALADAAQSGLAVIPSGGGTKRTWGNPPARADVALSTAKLNRVVEHAWSDLTATVEAGCTVGHLQSVLAEHGQRLALDPLWPESATIGGVLSTNDTGVLRLSFGGLRDLIIGVTLVLPDGTIAESGGKVVKNVAGYDLPKLVTGALGTLGVIAKATFRLHPLPKQSKTLTFTFETLDAAQKFLLAVGGSKLAHTALQWRSKEAQQCDILIEGTEAGIVSQEALVRSLAPQASVQEGATGAWKARQDLWNGDGAVAKFSVLPSGIAACIQAARKAGATNIVAQATGLGFAAFSGEPAALKTSLLDLRKTLEAAGGSLVILRKPKMSATLETNMDTWGRPGDAFPLMLAIKQQFDPKGTLNPGRFVGGI